MFGGGVNMREEKIYIEKHSKIEKNDILSEGSWVSSLNWGERGLYLQG